MQRQPFRLLPRRGGFDVNKVSLPFPRSSIDSVGASLSMACAIHCMAVPFLIAILPFWGMGFLVAEGFGQGIVFCSVFLATGSLCWGFKLHRKWGGMVALVSGAIMIFAGHLLVDETYEMPLSVVGAACLAAAHLMNRQLCNRCVRCQAQGEAT